VDPFISLQSGQLRGEWQHMNLLTAPALLQEDRKRPQRVKTAETQMSLAAGKKGIATAQADAGRAIVAVPPVRPLRRQQWFAIANEAIKLPPREQLKEASVWAR
jgi:hypothetical protein